MYYLSVSNKTSFVQLIAFSINLNYNTFSLNYMQSFPWMHYIHLHLSKENDKANSWNLVICYLCVLVEHDKAWIICFDVLFCV